MPSLALRGFWGYRIFAFGPIGQPGQYGKKRVGTDYEQLLSAFFHVFGVKIFIFIFFENTIASALKSCIIPFLQKKNSKFFSSQKSEKKCVF